MLDGLVQMIGSSGIRGNLFLFQIDLENIA